MAISFEEVLQLWPLWLFLLIVHSALSSSYGALPNPDDALIQAGLTDEEIDAFNRLYDMNANTRK